MGEPVTRWTRGTVPDTAAAIWDAKSGPWPPLTTPLQPGQLDLPPAQSPFPGGGGGGRSPNAPGTSQGTALPLCPGPRFASVAQRRAGSRQAAAPARRPRRPSPLEPGSRTMSWPGPERRGRSWGRGGLGTRRLGGGVQGGGPAISLGSKWGWHRAGCGGTQGAPGGGASGGGASGGEGGAGAGGTLALWLRLQQDAPSRGPQARPGTGVRGSEGRRRGTIHFGSAVTLVAPL